MIPTKNPAIDWQSRGFLEILYSLLEVSSRDASAAMPHGRLSNDSLVAQAVNKRSLHFSNGLLFTTIHRELSSLRKQLVHRVCQAPGKDISSGKKQLLPAHYLNGRTSFQNTRGWNINQPIGRCQRT